MSHPCAPLFDKKHYHYQGDGLYRPLVGARDNSAFVVIRTVYVLYRFLPRRYLCQYPRSSTAASSAS